MPLVRVDVVRGQSPEALGILLDALHRAMVRAFEVPMKDRYQILTEHPSAFLVVEDTGLDIPRTEKRVVILVTSRPRSVAKKKAFYEEVCRELKLACDIDSKDVVIALTINSDEDWSFGFGHAQFLTGEL